MQFSSLFFPILFGLIIYLVIRPAFLSNIQGRKHYYFDFEKFSAQEFYDLVKKAVERREIPGVAISKVTFVQGGWLEGKREYLRISRKDQTFDICAAPFGTGFFVSYWLGEKNAYLKKI